MAIIIKMVYHMLFWKQNVSVFTNFFPLLQKLFLLLLKLNFLLQKLIFLLQNEIFLAPKWDFTCSKTYFCLLQICVEWLWSLIFKILRAIVLCILRINQDVNILAQWESNCFNVCNMPQPVITGIYKVYQFYLSYFCMLTSIYIFK